MEISLCQMSAVTQTLAAFLYILVKTITNFSQNNDTHFTSARKCKEYPLLQRQENNMLKPMLARLIPASHLFALFRFNPQRGFYQLSRPSQGK